MTDILTSKIEITAPGRPCWVEEHKYSRTAPCEVIRRKAILHVITTWANVIEPSIMKGGHAGGQISRPVAVVEFEDGRIRMVELDNIQLLDSADRFVFTDEPSPWDED